MRPTPWAAATPAPSYSGPSERWAIYTVYQFRGGAADGDGPHTTPTFVEADRAFGTTYESGSHLAGAVYQLIHRDTARVETPIYQFRGLPFGSGADGPNPTAGVVVLRDGRPFDTTNYGGTAGVDTVYELKLDGAGGWTEPVLYSFTDRADGGTSGFGP